MKLSLRALGCWFVIANMKKQGERITLKEIENKTESSGTAIRNGIGELIEKGYLERKFIREKGKIRGISYVIKANPRKEGSVNGEV